MTRVASLGMYDGPEVAAANDRLWELIAERLAGHGLEGVPAKLDRARPLEAVFDDSGLLLAQCCGYPLVTRYRERLRYVATPGYAVSGGAAGRHRSRIVVRADDPATRLAELRGRRAALNARDSNSGMNLFRAAVAPLAAGGRFFAEVVETGSHDASLRAVAAGRADAAAIDAVSFEHAAVRAPAIAAAVRTIAWTPASAGLPFVTAAAASDAMVDLLRDALRQVVGEARAGPACKALRLRDIEQLPCSAYDRVAALEQEAVRRGYPELA